MLKNISEIISPHISFLINQCMETEHFPTALKLGIIKPLFKGGDVKEVNNYRPITLITSIAKIFEMSIKTRIVKFLDKCDGLSENQFGFRPGRSTEDAIVYLTKNIYKALDNKESSLCIFVDLAKAFDTVCHKKLIQKLERHGIRGPCLGLLKSYLNDRKQAVSINKTTSSMKNITYGVPQGTVLGPLLFIIYMNDIFKLDIKGKIGSFADDTFLFVKTNSWDETKQTAENDFKKLQDWFDYNKLTLNKKRLILFLFPHITRENQT